MKKKGLLILGFGLLTLMNVVIFANRKHFEFRSFSSPSKLYGSCDTDCMEKWGAYTGDYPPDDFTAADKILDPVVGKGDSTVNKIILISQFLLKYFDDQRGVPSELLLSKNPVSQYNLLRTHPNEKLWCGNWSNMFAFFAWNRGITTRIIEIMKPGDHHVMNECYIPEIKNWALVDLTNKIVLPRDEKGGFYSAFSYAERLRRDARPDREMDSINSPPIAGSGYYAPLHPWYYYYQYNLEAVYSHQSRLKRYIIPDPWYEILDLQKTTPGNFRFFVKLGAVCLWIIFLFMLGMTLISRQTPD